MTAFPAPSVSQQRYPPITGYSTSHSQHAQHTSAWSNRAYKGLNSSQVRMVRINLYVYEPTFNTKGQPCIVDVSHFFWAFLIISLYIQGIKEGLRVSSDITTSTLCCLIKETLHLPLVEYCGSIPFDIDEMVVRDASNSGWMRLDSKSDETYFGDMFLKPHPCKKDGGLIFLPQQIWNRLFLDWFSIPVSGKKWKRFERLRYVILTCIFLQCLKTVKNLLPVDV